MPDITKKILFEMFECVDDPVIEDRATGWWSQNLCYEDVLLAFSNSDLKVSECLRIKEIEHKLTLGTPRTIILATCRWDKYDPDNNGWERFQKKKAKYERWLKEWEADQCSG